MVLSQDKVLQRFVEHHRRRQRGVQGSTALEEQDFERDGSLTWVWRRRSPT